MIFNNTYLKNILFVCIVLIITVIVFYLNSLFPLYSDDFHYLYITSSDQSFVPVKKISDIFVSQYNHYFQWGGRSVVHFIAQCILLLDDNTADFVNTFAYIFLVLIIYFISNKGKKTNICLFLLINMIVWFVVPTPLGTILWITGSANYTWGTLIILLFVFQYYSYWWSEESKDSIIKSVLFFLFGILAGWSNENISAALLFILICFLVVLIKSKKNIPHWFVAGLAGTFLGFIFMCLAPGNYVRSIEILKYFNITALSRFKIFRIQIGNMFSYGFIPIVCIAFGYFLLLFLYYSDNYKEKKRKIIGGSLAFMLAGFIGFSALIVLPYIPVRAFYGINIFVLISFAILYANISLTSLKRKIINFVCFALFTVYFIIQFMQSYDALVILSETTKYREKLIYEQKRKGEFDVILPENLKLAYGLETLSTDSLDTFNQAYSRFYGIKTVRLVPEDKFDK